MSIPNLTEELIRQYATEKSFQRGEEYYHGDLVLSLIQRGDLLKAEVEGSQYDSYQIQVTLEAEEGIDAVCDCPYDWGGWCKHIVAVLLTCVHKPEEIELKSPLEQMLAGLDRDQLKILLLQLNEQNPSLDNQIESQILTIQSMASSGKSSSEKSLPNRQKQLNPAPFRRQVRDILRSLDHMRRSEAYWHVEGTVDQMRQVLGQAQAFVNAEDGRNALLVLEAITDEYVRGWLYLDDSDGFAGEFFGDLGAAWTEAFLTADLTPTETKIWTAKLAEWQEEVEDYGIEEYFDAAQAAALQGWDYPPLQRILKGETPDEEESDFGPTWHADELAIARLNVLERQERYDEYLFLAKAEGLTARCVIMLVALGRIEEAVEYGRKHITTTEDASSLAQVLHAQGATEKAVEIAERGLTLSGLKFTLANWLCNLAEETGKTELALRAAVIAFKANSVIETYLRVSGLAGVRWPEIKDELLTHMVQKETGMDSSKVGIYLHEGMLEEAMRVVDTGYVSFDILRRVVEAATQSHPDWAIHHSQSQAERIMDPGKAKYYRHAANWLTKARAAYRTANREPEWQKYLSDLMQKHSRKYKLMPMLKELE